MFVQTIFSDWQTRAISELIKTFLFFFSTHVFFAMMLQIKNLIGGIRTSLVISALFICYLAYLYLYQFGAFFIGNDLSQMTADGRNTLSLFIFLNIVMSMSFITISLSSSYRLLGYFLLIFFLAAGFLTGSRFSLIFPLIFLIPIFLKYFLMEKLTKRALIRNVTISIILITMVVFLFSYFEILFLEGYLSGLDRIMSFGQNNSDSERIILLNTGVDCFLNNNILVGHGVKDYLTCVLNSPLRTDYILHNDHLSILNNVGIIGYLSWLIAITTYSKILYFSGRNYIYGFGVLVYLSGLLVVDGYNSPIFAILLAFSRLEWSKRSYKTV